MKITAYVHPPADKTAETPDTRPGSYYVSARDGASHWLLLGPFVDDQVSVSIDYGDSTFSSVPSL